MFEHSRRWALVALLSLVTACGGVHRSTVVAEPSESPGLIDAIDQVARARGLRTRTRPERVVKILFDPATHTRITFSVHRHGLVMAVHVDDERVAPSDVEAEIARAQTAGRAMLDQARVQYAETQRQAALAEAQERERQRQQQEQAQREADTRAAQSAQLQQFMDQNQARHEQFMQRTQACPQPAPQPGAGAAAQSTSTQHCCINGAYYACPSASAVDQCVGAFTRCLSGCGFECVDQCMQSNPPDPSSCRREPAHDGDC